MAVEFRQRSMGEFWKMLKRNKWQIILPMVAMGIAVGYVVQKLPDMYESRTVLAVKAPSISDVIVKTLSEEDLSQKLQTMNQEILSRSSLEPMIAKYKLFEQERNSGMPMELIVEKMKGNIKQELQKAEDGKVTGFSLTYRDRTAESVHAVTSDLASRYVNEQVTTTLEEVNKTREFIEQRLGESKATLDGLEQQRNLIMTQNQDKLPDTAGIMSTQMTSLTSKRDSLAKEKDSLINERGRIGDGIRVNNAQINTIETLVSKEVDNATKNSTRIEQNPAYAQLFEKQTRLEAELKNLLGMYKEKHPDVIAKRNEIAENQKGLDQLERSMKRIQDDAKSTNDTTTEIRKKGFQIENARLEDNLKRIETQINQKDVEMGQVGVEIDAINARLNEIPGVRNQLQAIEADYQRAKTSYDDLKKKSDDIELQLKRDQNIQGERITVVDPASLPQAPVNASKKPLFTGGGIALGAILGLLFAGMFEIPRMFKIQNIEDAKYYTGLPVLASVPPLLTRKEISWQKRSHLLKILAGLILAFGSIPLLIFVLQKSHVLDRLV